MTIDEIFEIWKKDSDIDLTELDQESIKIPKQIWNINYPISTK